MRWAAIAIALAGCPKSGPVPEPPAPPEPAPAPAAPATALCGALGEVLADAEHAFEHVRGDLVPDEEGTGIVVHATTVDAGADEAEIVEQLGETTWSATFYDQGLTFQSMFDELRACDAIAAEPDEPDDVDGDGDPDEVYWFRDQVMVMHLQGDDGGAAVTVYAPVGH